MADPPRRVLCGQKDPFYRAWRNASTMLCNRGYRSDEPPLDEGELLRRLAAAGDHHLLWARRRPGTGEEQKLLMYITVEVKVGIKTVRKLHQALKGSDIENAVVLYQASITPFARQAIKNMLAQEGLRIETFCLLELAIDLIQHKYVPKHTVLTPAEKQAVLDRYDKNVDLYPKILAKDKCARYYGMVPGDMVRIDRYYENYGEYTTYRVVA